MDLSGSTALITGGASGIGLALAARMLDAGARVVVCGRREEKLAEAREHHASLCTRQCDVGDAREREALAGWVTAEFPGLNVLVNNAGIQRRFALEERQRWAEIEQEIDVNLSAPIHLSLLLAPHLRGRPGATIVNVTSGLAFVPMASAPVYCATKAALHSFTLSLRHQLAGSSIEVVEIIPPAVNTDLGGPGLHNFGEPLDEFADAVVERLVAGDREIAYGSAARSSRASREELDHVFERMNPRGR